MWNSNNSESKDPDKNSMETLKNALLDVIIQLKEIIKFLKSELEEKKPLNMGSDIS